MGTIGREGALAPLFSIGPVMGRHDSGRGTAERMGHYAHVMGVGGRQLGRLVAWIAIVLAIQGCMGLVARHRRWGVALGPGILPMCRCSAFGHKTEERGEWLEEGDDRRGRVISGRGRKAKPS